MGPVGLWRAADCRALPIPFCPAILCWTTSKSYYEKNQDYWVTVVIPEILPARWWQNILHNQRALGLKAALLFKDRVILTDVPFHLKR